MSDLDFTPVPAIPVPEVPASPSPLSAPRPPGAGAGRFARLAFAVLVPLVLYAEAGSGYFTTACRPIDVATNLGWGLFILIALPAVMPIPFVISYLVLAGGTLAIPRGARAVRIRNRVAVGLAVVVPIAASIVGAIAPTRCSLF
jgi:hypothetical protein